jgi:hypothetical protein
MSEKERKREENDMSVSGVEKKEKERDVYFKKGDRSEKKIICFGQRNLASCTYSML